MVKTDRPQPQLCNHEHVLRTYGSDDLADMFPSSPSEEGSLPDEDADI